MAIESPLFQSAMELLGHSLEHYNGKNELDRKLVILHLANAVELVLKDLLLDSGQSIYKSPKETITIQGCLSALESNGIQLPLLNKIELLFDERNALQHRFGSPNQLTSIFYMGIAQQFFKVILKEYYALEYDEVIVQFTDEQSLAAFRLNEPSNDQELEKLQELAKIHPLGALLAAWTYFERTIDNLMDSWGLPDFMRGKLFMDLMRGRLQWIGIPIGDELNDALAKIRKIRNISTHGTHEPTKEEVTTTIKVIERVESYLRNLNVEDIRSKAQAEIEKSSARRLALGVRRAVPLTDLSE